MKFKSAEHKRKFIANKAAWESLLDKNDPSKFKFSKTNRKIKNNDSYVFTPAIPDGRSAMQYPSRDSGFDITPSPDVKKYTGTQIIGVAVMHKSNLVPVSSYEEVEQISKMRR